MEPSHDLSEGLLALIETQFRAIVLVTLAGTVALSIPLPEMHVESSFEGWMDTRSDLFETYRQFTRSFGGDDTLTVVFQTRDVLRDQVQGESARPVAPAGPSLSALERHLALVETLRTMRGIVTVVDPVSLYLRSAGAWTGAALPFGDARALAQLRAELQKVFRGNLDPFVSRDLTTVGMLIHLDPGMREQYPAIVNDARQALDRTGIRYHLAGVAFFSAALAESISRDLSVVIALLVGIALTVLGFYLRNWLVTVCIFAGIGVALVYTLGIGLLLGMKVTLLTLILFPLLFCVGLTTAIHLYSRRINGVWHFQPAFRTTIKPAATAMATTALGSCAFLFSPQPTIHQMGILLPLGIVLVFLSIMVFVPSLIYWTQKQYNMPTPRTIWSGCPDPLPRRSRLLVSAMLCGAVLGSITVLPRISTNPDAMFFFERDSALVRSYRFIEERLAGLLVMELVIRSGDQASLVQQPHRMQIGNYLAALQDMPSLTTLSSAFDLLPEDGRAPPAELAHFLDETGRAMRVSLRFRNLSEHLYSSIASELYRRWQRLGLDRKGLSMQLTGQLPMILDAQDRLLGIQARVFVVVLALIAALLFMILRSGIILVLALIANFVPLLITGGAMGFLGIPLNSINLFVGSVLLGVIVDDTIHLLYALRETGAIDEALAQVGPALWITTVTMTLAFLSLMASDIVPVVQFGLLSGTAVVSAYLCDVYLLPFLVGLARVSPRAA